MDGDLIVDVGSITEVIAVVMGQPDALPRWSKLQQWTRALLRRYHQFNPPKRSAQNVAAHYDLDGRLYRLFLDTDMQYSCAYFETPASTLEEAQLAKKRHLAAKLLADPRHRVLDIGCGWGGLGIYLAAHTGALVEGITLSDEQLAVASQRAKHLRLQNSVEFRKEDYRDTKGTFDRIVSVGMFEHVGIGFYDAFFKRCSDLLAEDGVMVLHAIGRSEGPGFTNPWIAKYIFPGGYSPALSEVVPSIERAGLLVNDVEVLRLHYAETLKAWRERFMANTETATALYDDRFVRMWEFYLAASEMSFRKQNLFVFQIQLSKRQGIIPMTRDYIARDELRLACVEGKTRALASVG
jgi:cyclopropane-fatty-acyl-phospholipid synthase